jgi:hypothetical protein
LPSHWWEQRAPRTRRLHDTRRRCHIYRVAGSVLGNDHPSLGQITLGLRAWDAGYQMSRLKTRFCQLRASQPAENASSCKIVPAPRMQRHGEAEPPSVVYSLLAIVLPVCGRNPFWRASALLKCVGDQPSICPRIRAECLGVSPVPGSPYTYLYVRPASIAVRDIR